MSHIISDNNIKLEIQAIGVKMNECLNRQLLKLIRKLKKYLPQMNFVDVYLKQSSRQSTFPRKLNIRFGVPGPDLAASEVGYSWKTLLKSVEKKLIRQLNRRKASTSKSQY
ncbi:MAG: HPF/RaiA family ribosome-associated protein [Flavisolibacter sp.]